MLVFGINLLGVANSVEELFPEIYVCSAELQLYLLTEMLVEDRGINCS